jgi:hypothetical protein
MHELLHCAGPTSLMADSGGLSGESRMSESKLCTAIDWLEIDLQTREMAGFGRLAPRRPLPAHHQTLRRHDLEILAGAFVLTSIEGTEPHPEPATHARICLGNQNRTGVRSPPARDPLGRCECFKDDRRPRLDPTDQGEACQGFFLFVSASLASA